MSVMDYIKENEPRFLDELKDYLRIPSISTDPARIGDVARCADWLVTHLRGIGMTLVERHDTAGHPIVYAEHLEAGPERPTILIYGHHDVQPPDPLELWETPPFEPTVRDGKIFARGATDDKGQLFAHVKALESHLKVSGSLPVNIKLVIEGEEEVGSTHLEPWVKANRERLSCDAVVISDSSMYAPGLPSITTALRGMAYFEIEVVGASHDLHSGMFGGATPNPINALGRIIASCHDDAGRILIDGFYDRVRALEASEREALAALPFDESEYLAETGAPAVQGEAGFTTLERRWARPTLDFNGVIGGFTGEGAKTVLPSKASAKFSCRLVADQDPVEIKALVEAHVARVAPPSVKVTVKYHHGSYPVQTERDNATMQAAMRALKFSWGVEPVFSRSGGSIPVVGTFSQVLGAPTVLMGLGLSDDRLHSPNEKFDLVNFYKGIRSSARLWDELIA